MAALRHVVVPFICASSHWRDAQLSNARTRSRHANDTSCSSGAEEPSKWVSDMHRRFSETYAKVVEATRASHRSDAHHVDRRNKGLNFRVDDLVLLYEPKQRRGVTPKLDAERWTGPWKVTTVISACVYAVKREGTNKFKVVNVDCLVPFVSRDLRRFPTEGQNDDNDVSEEEEGKSTGSISAEESTAKLKQLQTKLQWKQLSYQLH